MNKHFLSVSIVLLSIAIFYFAFQLGKSNSVVIEADAPIHTVGMMDNGLLTEEEVAAYLSMNIEQFKQLIKDQNFERASFKSFETFKFIPYIQINGDRYFIKNQVDMWINYNATNWKIIE